MEEERELNGGELSWAITHNQLPVNSKIENLWLKGQPTQETIQFISSSLIQK